MMSRVIELLEAELAQRPDGQAVIARLTRSDATGGRILSRRFDDIGYGHWANHPTVMNESESIDNPQR